jgi:hypothetical protein
LLSANDWQRVQVAGGIAGGGRPEDRNVVLVCPGGGGPSGGGGPLLELGAQRGRNSPQSPEVVPIHRGNTVQ